MSHWANNVKQPAADEKVSLPTTGTYRIFSVATGGVVGTEKENAPILATTEKRAKHDLWYLEKGNDGGFTFKNTELDAYIYVVPARFVELQGFLS